MNFIDLFAGAGGLSEGFIRAGFTPIAHVEMDEAACHTILTRTVYHHFKDTPDFEKYISYIKGEEISKEEFYNLLPKEKRESVINLPIGKQYNQTIYDKIDSLKGDKSIDLILGGPPCQAYSLVGRARDKNKMKDDPRNFLYKEYANFLKRYNPRMFVFENVRGLITADKGSYFKNMQAYFKRIGYEIEYTIQNAEDFGVLQKRRRIILIGWLKGSGLKYPKFSKVDGNYRILDILSDLKKLNPDEQNNITEYETEITEYLQRFEIRNGLDFVTQHIARPHNERDLEIYKIAIKKWINNKERLKYPDLPQRLKTHKNEKSFADRFKVVDPNGYAHTMVAHISKDGHHYIYPDLKQVRSLSVREAARIQSFPDDFYFEGGRGAAFKQIGNAVPPLMAFEIGSQIRRLLCQQNN